MNLNSLFEGAIDELEKRRIEDLEMKMDDLARRAKESKDPKYIAALRQEFAVAKAERDSYHYVREDDLEEHGGGGGGPAQWHAYVKAHRTDEWSNSAAGEPEQTDLERVVDEAGSPAQQAAIAIAKKKEQGVDEGWQDFNKKEPYEVCLAGKPVKTFDYYEDARRFHDNWKKKLYNQGEKEKADKITLNPIMKEEQKPYNPNEFRPVGPITIVPPKKLKSGETYQDRNKYWQSQGQAPIYKTNEGSMADASHHETGPKFGGYYKGTQIGAPKPGQSFGAESKETPQPRNFVAKNMKQSGQGKHTDAKRAMKQGDVKHKAQRIPADEGAKVDRMVQHITKSEKDLGKSKKDAEAIAWATANKRGMLDNANKKDESVDNSHATNFLTWVLNQGDRFRGFTKNPETYAQAKEAYKSEHGAEANFAEGMSNALSNITRRMAQPVNAKTIIKNREQKKKTIKTQNFAEDQLDEIKKGQKDSNGNSSCWTGYHAAGTKKGKNGGQVRNCVKNENVNEADPNAPYTPSPAKPFRNPKGFNKQGTGVGNKLAQQTRAELAKKKEQGVAEDWQKANKKDKTDGMSQKAVNAYKRENPGSKLKTAVTTKPSKLKKGSKDSKRRKSYCARSAGQKKMHNIDCSKTPDKAICKARKRWNCESQEQFDAMLREAVEKGTLQPGQYYVWTVYFDDGTNKRIKVTKDTFDPKAYYAKQNKVVVNVDYDWTPKNG